MRQKTFFIILFLALGSAKTRFWRGLASFAGGCAVTLFILFAVEGVFSVPAQAATYELAPGPYTVEDLGVVFSANNQEHQWMYRFPTNNDLHLIMYYDTLATSPLHFQILDMNLTQGIAHLTNGYDYRPGVYSTLLYTNNGINKIYIGNIGLMEYDPDAGTVNFIAMLDTNQTGSSLFAETMQVGDDGFIYIGETGGTRTNIVDGILVTNGCTRVERYNPITQVYENLGDIDTNLPATDLFAYTVGADTRYLYVGIGQRPWYLAVYDTQTKSKTTFWKPNGDTVGLVLQGKAGGWYYERVATTNVNVLWYVLTNGMPVEIAASNVPPCYSYSEEKPGIVKGAANFPSHYNTEINMDNAYPSSGNNQATIGWRTVGATNWQFITASNFFIAPVNVQRLYPYQGNLLFGFGQGYGYVFLYDLSNGSVTPLGQPQLSPYDVVFATNAIYLSGYDKYIFRYDPTKPWTLTASTTNFWSTNVNPYEIGLQLGNYNYYSALGSDGTLWDASEWVRNGTGSALAWYDPVTGNCGSISAIRNLDYNPRDLKPALNATKMVYSSEDGNLYVLDVATKTVERTNTPLGGFNLDKIVEVSPGIVFGATGSNIFLASITNNTVFYTNRLPGNAFSRVGSGSTYIDLDNERLTLGPDGYIWMFVNNSLYRIKPSDGSMTGIITNRNESLLMFNGGDLYFYGGPVFFTNNAYLYRIANILVRTDILYGDVDGNGEVTAYDAALTARHAVGYTDADFKDAAAADVDNIPGISAYDAALIAQRAVGLISRFPVEP